MSDRFDKAMAAIAIKSGKNGGPELVDVLTAMQAAHEDAVEAAERLAAKVEAAALVRLTEREELHAWQMQQAERCATEHQKLFEQEFDKLTARAPRRSDDPSDADFGADGVALAFSGGLSEHDKQVRKQFMSVTTRYLVVAIVIAMLLALAYALLVRHDDLQSDVATGLSSTIAVAMLIWAMLRKEK
jgi:hypothetical protein